MDIYVVKDAYVVPYLQDAYFDTQLPILPPEVRLVKISWFSHKAVVSLHNYVLSVPRIVHEFLCIGHEVIERDFNVGPMSR